MISIRHYCVTGRDRLIVDGQVKFVGEKDSTDPFERQLYRFLKLDYSRFYKMDVLSQRGFLGVEVLKTECPELVTCADDAVALLFSNADSSAETDLRFQESYQKLDAPSPSLFVYTLPNIVLGELAIRNKWYGENMFVVSNSPDLRFFVDYSGVLMEKGSGYVIAGWIGAPGQASVFILLDKFNAGNRNTDLNVENLQRIFDAANNQTI